MHLHVSFFPLPFSILIWQLSGKADVISLPVPNLKCGKAYNSGPSLAASGIQPSSIQRARVFSDQLPRQLVLSTTK